MQAIVSILLFALVIAGCSSEPRLPTLADLPSVADLPFVHKVDVQQGNVVTQDMLAQLSPQMDKKKVLFIMGSPIVQDTFNNTRWDYIYTFTPGGGRTERRLVTLYFVDDKLDHIEGDIVPASGPLVAQLHHDMAVQVPRLKKKSFAKRMQEKLPFVEPEPEEVVEVAPDGSLIGEEASEDVIPLAPLAETEKRSPYEDLQSAPGEGIVVPPDAPTLEGKKGFLTRVFDSIGLGAEDEPDVDDEDEEYDPGDPKYRDITDQKNI